MKRSMEEAGLMVEVLRSAVTGDCTNGGASSAFNVFTLVGEGIIGPAAPNSAFPGLRLVMRMLGGKPYFHAEPDEPSSSGHYMFGGNFIWSSDSRFRRICEYPVPIHDRSETIG